MATAPRVSDTAPMMDINTTPLIDVMLVLLIMFIITVPLQSHAVKLDLPSTTPPPTVVNPIKNKITIDRTGTIFWNGSAVNAVTLRQYLDVTANMPDPPELHLQPAPDARYEVVDEVMAMTKRANVRTMGFVGNQAYAKF